MTTVVMAATTMGAAWGAEPPTEVEVPNCLIVPNKDVEVSARIEGEIRAVLVDDGDPVKVGQRLAQMVDDQAQIEERIRALAAADDTKIRIAKFQHDVLKYKLESDRRLRKTKSISELELLQSEARLGIGTQQVRQSEMELERAKLMHTLSATKLRFHRVISPIDGEVAQTFKEAGEAVRMHDPILRIIDISVVRVEGYLSVKYLDAVRKGQSVVVRLTRTPDQAYRGTLIFTDVQVESASDTFRVKAEVPNPKGLIRPGLRATMRIILTPAPKKGK